MNLSAVTVFCVDYPNRRSLVEYELLVWVGRHHADAYSAAESLQELPRTLSHWSSKGQGVPIQRGAMRRAGLAGRPFFDNTV